MDSMKRCENCRHWNPSHSEKGICTYLSYAEFSLASLESECDCSCTIQTNRSFGCVAFENKEPSLDPIKAKYKHEREAIFRKIQSGVTFIQLSRELGVTPTTIRARWVADAINEMQRTGNLVTYHSAIKGGEWPPRHGWKYENRQQIIPSKIQAIIDNQEGKKS